MGQMSRIDFALNEDTARPRVLNVEILKQHEPRPVHGYAVDGVTVRPLPYCKEPSYLLVTHYAIDKSLALCGRLRDGTPAYKASVYIPGQKPSDGCIWVKTWGENKGMLEALQAAGVVEFTGRFTWHQGNAAFECELLV